MAKDKGRTDVDNDNHNMCNWYDSFSKSLLLENCFGAGGGDNKKK